MCRTKNVSLAPAASACCYYGFAGVLVYVQRSDDSTHGRKRYVFLFGRRLVFSVVKTRTCDAQQKYRCLITVVGGPRETVQLPGRFRSTIIINRSPNRVRGPRPGSSSHPPRTPFRSTITHLSTSIPSRIVIRETLNFSRPVPSSFRNRRVRDENNGTPTRRPGSAVVVEYGRYADARASSTLFRSNKQRPRGIHQTPGQRTFFSPVKSNDRVQQWIDVDR